MRTLSHDAIAKHEDAVDIRRSSRAFSRASVGSPTQWLVELKVDDNAESLQEARAIIQGIDLAAHNLGEALVPQSAARFQRAGALFKPLTDKLI